MSHTPGDARPSDLPESTWQEIVARYQRPTVARSGLQLATALPPFAACWAAAAWLLDPHPVWSVACCVMATGFLVRIYIIQHDCGHGSFFKTAHANDLLGSLLGVLTLLPYYRWRHDHAVHHAGNANLARRGIGDVWTMTITEYMAASPRERVRYRLFRNPWVLFGLGPLVLFVVWQRFTGASGGRRERASVYGTNLAVMMLVVLGGRYVGWIKLLVVHGAITAMASTIAVWLFYIQHQFEHVYWAAPAAWSYSTGALQGASWYRLPKVLQWFTGSIGLHHVHHLSPKIPNYELQRCIDENPLFQTANVITLRAGFRCASLKVWDDQQRRLVSWREAQLPAFGLADLWAAVRNRESPRSQVDSAMPDDGLPRTGAPMRSPASHPRRFAQ